jgi:hypothetical protein
VQEGERGFAADRNGLGARATLGGSRAEGDFPDLSAPLFFGDFDGWHLRQPPLDYDGKDLSFA